MSKLLVSENARHNLFLWRNGNSKLHVSETENMAVTLTVTETFIWILKQTTVGDNKLKEREK